MRDGKLRNDLDGRLHPYGFTYRVYYCAHVLSLRYRARISPQREEEEEVLEVALV